MFELIKLITDLFVLRDSAQKGMLSRPTEVEAVNGR
jgi:hypothetical protein